jgi:hypothetical protein
MRLFLAGIRKLRTRTAGLVAAISAAIAVALEFLLVGVSLTMPTASSGTDPKILRWLLTFPGAYDAILAIVFVFGGLAAIIYVAVVAGTEWSWGTLKVAVARGESRSRYALATYGSLAALLAGGVLIAFLGGVLGAIAGATIAGIPISGLTDASAMPHVAVALVRCWIAVVSFSAIGYAIAMMARSQMAGVGMGIGVYIASLVVPIALSGVFRDVLKYLPFSVATDAMALNGPPVEERGSAAAAAIEPNLALVITLGWLIGSLVVAAWATERADVPG